MEPRTVPLPGLLPSDSTFGAWLLVPHSFPDRQRVILPQSGVRVEPATLPPVFASPPGRGCPVSRHEVWRDFFYSSVFYKSKFFIDFDFYFCKISSWTTGKAGNTAPRGQVPTPTRRTYRLSGREAPSNRGVGAEEAPPQARTKLTRAGIQTAGKTANRPRRDGGRIKQGDERCGRWGR